MKITEENIWKETRKRNLEVLRSGFVDKVKSNNGWTPLHNLAWRGVKEVLSHPSVDKVKDDFGDTPLHVFSRFDYFTKKDLRKKYPWYKKEIKSVYKAVNDIVNTPKSIQFILED